MKKRFIYLSEGQKHLVDHATSLNNLHYKLFSIGCHPQKNKDVFNKMEKAWRFRGLIKVIV